MSSNQNRPKLGELLVRNGLVTRAQVEEALAAQVIYAGRIGSNLVEMHFIDLNTISHLLTEQLGVPAPDPKLLERVDRQTLAVVPKEICEKHKVFPFRVEGKRLHLAMLDPHRFELVDHLAFSLGYSIKTYVMPQLRLLYYLETHYDIPRPKRYLRAPEKETTIGALTSRIPPQPAPNVTGPHRIPAIQSGTAPPPVPGQQKTMPPATPGTDRRRYLQPTFGPALTGSGHPAIPPGATGPGFPAVPPGATGPGHPAVPPGATGPHQQVPRPTGAGHPPTHPTALHPTVQQPTATHLTVSNPTMMGHAAVSPQPADLSASDEDDELMYLDEHTNLAATEEAFDFEIDVDLDVDEASAAQSLAHSPAETAALLSKASSREQIVKALIQPSFPKTSLAALFLLRGELAVAIGCWGTELKSDQVRALVVPTNIPSLFKQVIDSRKPVCSGGTEDSLQKMISGYLRAPVPAHVCVMPVVVGDRLVNLLCLHATEPFPDDVLEKLADLSTAAAKAYLRLIQQHKQQDA